MPTTRALAALILTSFLSAAATADAGLPRAFTNQQGRFSLQIPAQWKTEQDPILALKAVKASASDTQADAERVQVAVGPRVEGVDLKQYVQNSTQALSSHSP